MVDKFKETRALLARVKSYTDKHGTGKAKSFGYNMKISASFKIAYIALINELWRVIDEDYTRKGQRSSFGVMIDWKRWDSMLRLCCAGVALE
jgi:hypothetical protein